ncbi:MAG: hypothetical protein KIT79_14405 [Deltaproteobacteria bacterium]|nr:hypothetical protein [Deltaproteobacteria bacterium]
MTVPRAASLPDLLWPRIRGARNGFRHRTGERYRAVFLAGLALFSWGLIFGGTWRVLRYLDQAPQVGPLVAKNILAILVILLLSLLLYSSVISALSTFFLSRDLDLLFPAPIPVVTVFRAKFVETLLASSWMMFVFITPVLAAYGIRLGAPWWFYPGALVAWVIFCTFPVSAGTMLVFALVNIFPARRLRDILMVFFLVIAAGFVYFARYLRPERLTDPEARASVQDYIRGLEVGGSPLMPSTWFAELLAFGTGLPAMKGDWLVLYAVALPVTALALYFVAEWMAARVYFQGWSLTQESKRVDPEAQPVHSGHTGELVKRSGFIRLVPDRLRRALDRGIVLVARGLALFAPKKARPILEKDLLVFFRDAGQWSQMLVIGAVGAVYLLNIWALNLQKGVDLPPVRGTISFLNMGMVAFVLTSVIMRFAYPAVSIEGESFWILRTAALPSRAIIAAKFWTYFPPLLLLSQGMIFASNHLLEVPAYLVWLGPLFTGVLSFSLVALGIGIGAMYPNFRAENVSQVSLSYGGLVFMLVALGLTALVMTLLAGPAYVLFTAELRGRLLTGGETVLIGSVVAACMAGLAGAGVWALRRGIRALDALSA